MGREKRKTFLPVDIVYIAKSVRLAYRAITSRGKRDIESLTAEYCSGCNKFFIQKKDLEKHLEICGAKRGVIYKFENQNISSFEDNIKFMREVPFAIYFDLKTTCGKKSTSLTM